jgi:hypothetical protein
MSKLAGLDQTSSTYSLCVNEVEPTGSRAEQPKDETVQEATINTIHVWCKKKPAGSQFFKGKSTYRTVLQEELMMVCHAKIQREKARPHLYSTSIPARTWLHSVVRLQWASGVQYRGFSIDHFIFDQHFESGR